MPLFWLCLSFTAGIFLAALFPLSAWTWLTASVILLAAAWLEGHFCNKTSHPLLSRPLFQIPFALIGACLALGGWRFQSAQPQIHPDDLAWYADGENRVVTARIVSYPEESADSTRAVLQAISFFKDGRETPVKGKLELRLPGGFHLSYGDIVQLEGPLDAVLDDDQAAYQSYLAREGILSRMYYPQVDTLAQEQGNLFMGWIYLLRERAQDIIFEQIPFPESTLLGGILLGIDWQIPDYLEEAYRSCGVLHIIAISGYNIALISGLIIRLARRFLSPAKAGAAAILTIAIYTLMVGAEPAVVRAAIMGSLAIPSALFRAQGYRAAQPGGGGGHHAGRQPHASVEHRFPTFLHGLPGLDHHGRSHPTMDGGRHRKKVFRNSAPVVAADYHSRSNHIDCAICRIPRIIGA